jgi:hypothetical protein
VTRTLESEIDRLYQAGLDVFTAERNALAKRAGPEAGRVKALMKPALAAWAVNQVYWRARPVYQRLIKAAERLRGAHRSALIGRAPDLREADEAHAAALKAALVAAVDLLSSSGHPVTDATRQALSETLQALPADATPGRLTQPLRPAGFEILAGLPPAPLRLVPKPAGGRPDAAAPKTAGRPARRDLQAARKAAREAAQAVDALQRELQRVESRLERSRREMADARDAERDARARLEAVQRELEEARQKVDATQRESTDLRSRMADAERTARLADAQLADLERADG